MSYLKPSSLVTLLTNAVVVLISLHQTCANHGMDFVLALPCSDHPGAMAYIYITPYNTSSPVNVTWTSPKEPNRYFQANVLGSELYIIQYDLRPPASAVHVLANESVIILLSVVFSGPQVYSRGTFLACPMEQLSRSYIAVTHYESGNCILLITSPYDKASVTVTVKLTPETANITYNEKMYFNEEVLNLNLSAWQTVQLNSGSADLTGSTVACSQAIDVVSGGNFMLSDTTSKIDVQIEQMPTEDLLGTEFVLINFVSSNNSATIIKIAYTQENTNLAFTPPSFKAKLMSANWVTYNFREGMSAYLSSNKPVIVELVYEAITTISPNNVASVVVIPISSWASRYVTIMGKGSVTLVTTEACVTNILMNKTAVNTMTQWDQISQTLEYFFATVVRSSDSIVQVILEGENGCTFGGYITYQNGDGFTAFPIGWKKFEPENSLPSFTFSEDNVQPTASSMLSSTTLVMHTEMTSSPTNTFIALPLELPSSEKNLASLSAALYLSTSDILASGYDLYAPSLQLTQSLADDELADVIASSTVFSIISAPTYDLDQSTTNYMLEDISSSLQTSFSKSVSRNGQNSAGWWNGKNDGVQHYSRSPTKMSKTATSVQLESQTFQTKVSYPPSMSLASPYISTDISTITVLNTSNEVTLSFSVQSDKSSSNFHLESSLISTKTQFKMEGLLYVNTNAITDISSDINITTESLTPSSSLRFESTVISSYTQFPTSRLALLNTNTTTKRLADGKITITKKTLTGSSRHPLESTVALTYTQFTNDMLTLSSTNMIIESLTDIKITNETLTPSSIFPLESTMISTYFQLTTDRMLDMDLTTELLKDTRITTKASAGIKMTTEIFDNNRTNDKSILMNSNATDQCPCQCRSQYYLNLTGDSTEFRKILTSLQKDIQVEKKTLIAYITTKTCLENVEHSTKYYGFTLGILVVVLVLGFLFSLDMMNLYGKKTYASRRQDNLTAMTRLRK